MTSLLLIHCAPVGEGRRFTRYVGRQKASDTVREFPGQPLDLEDIENLRAGLMEEFNITPPEVA